MQLFVSNRLQDSLFKVKWLHRVKHTEHFMKAPVFKEHLVDSFCNSTLNHGLVSLYLYKDGKKAELNLGLSVVNLTFRTQLVPHCKFEVLEQCVDNTSLVVGVQELSHLRIYQTEQLVH